MRTYLLPLASLPFVGIGCFDRLGDDPQFDAGGIHFDGGGVDASLHDGSTPDGSPSDGAPFDAAPLAVKVVVLKGGLPESGVNVVFQDSTGAVVEAKTTAGDGTASRVIDSGSMVTVALGGGAAPKLVTVVGVKPGDTLTALDDADGDPSHFDEVTADVPLNPPSGTSTYQSHSGACTSAESQGGPTDFEISAPSCQLSGRFPVLTFANDTNLKPLGFAFKKGNVIGSGVTAVTGLSAWATPSSVTLTANDATSDVSLGYSEIATGIPYSDGRSGTPTAGSFSSTFATYPGYADAVQIEMGTTAPRGTGGVWTSAAAIAKRLAPPAVATAFDVAQLLPPITDMTSDVSDRSRPSVTITLGATATGADGLVLQMTWSSFDVDAGAVNGTWFIVAPPSTTTVKAPSLPTALAAWTPSASAQLASPAVVIFDSDLLPGYDAFRSVFGTFPAPLRFTPSTVLVPALPANGTLRVSSITESPS